VCATRTPRHRVRAGITVGTAVPWIGVAPRASSRAGSAGLEENAELYRSAGPRPIAARGSSIEHSSVSSLRGVLLDAGNTLVFVDPRRVVPVLVEAGAHAAEGRYWGAEREARLALSVALGRDRDVRGSEDSVWKDYFDRILRLTGVAEDRLEACAAVLRGLHVEDHLWTWVQEGAADALTRVHDLGYRVGVVSNADGRVEDLLRRVGLADLVEFVIDSRSVGVAKPDPRIFRMGAERLGLRPEECLYVGDLYGVDVMGARAAGLVPLLLDPFDRFGEWEVERVATVCDLPGWLESRAGRPLKGRGRRGAALRAEGRARKLGTFPQPETKSRPR
jgi:putative hydrolase of the HAD superfamily